MRGILLVGLWLLSLTAAAQVPSWQILSQESSISFTAMQENSPVTGKFTGFTGKIQADPTQLNESSVHIAVDMNSVKTDYDLIANTLKTAEWFDTQHFPTAVFDARHFTQTGKNSYQAEGNMTLRDKTLPVLLHFTLEKYANNKANIRGSFVLKRLAFGIGQGEWAKTDQVKDDVTVNFVIAAVKK